ncbi:MAG: hypothetical protein SX243_15000 [Acidobacteriota bacterium]|nr:hypothetical protein [Acidobacteriota bacterium]
MRSAVRLPLAFSFHLLCLGGLLTCPFLSAAEVAAAEGVTQEAWPEDLEAREPVLETHHFTFYSHFGFNLYDALLTTATGQLKDREDPLRSTECFADLGKSQRAGWEAAVDYFADTVAATSDFSTERFVLRSYLANLDIDFSAESQEYRRVSILLLRAAAPAYRTCRWPEQDAANRRWIAELGGRLSQHGDAIAGRITGWMGASWRQLPIPVDIVETVGWAGADTIGRPKTHIQMSSTNPGYQGYDALEMIFHEASHELLSGRSGPVAEMIREASEETGIETPRSLWHGILFVTAGEAAREVLEAAGEGPRQPYAEAQGVFRGHWQPLWQPLQDHWMPYLRGETSAAEALRRVLMALDEPSEG